MTSEAEHRSISFLSWNTNGLKNTKKFKQKFCTFLDTLTKLKADIVFIQETHIGTSEFQDLDRLESWNAFFTVHSDLSKGVAIMIKKDLQFEYICHDEDCSGGYIVLFCYLYGELFTLVNVYNHKDDRIVLGRLKEYLTETAEGVLVVGGDFNTVLYPILDRKPSTARHSPFRHILEDFTLSLNLKDTWSYLHPTEEGFTRRQNQSYSRLDMFFMQEDKMSRVCSIKPLGKQKISDHYPLGLTLTVHVHTEKKIPNVATKLTEYKHNSDRRAGKISGEEILSVIRSLPESEEARPDELQISTYKSSRCSLAEIYKRDFNSMLKNNCLYTDFNVSYISGDRHIFNGIYLIFTQVLAKRLSAFITPSFKGPTNRNLKIVFRLTCDSGEQQISWSFLQEALANLTQTPSTPPPDFSILDCILPKVQSSGELRRLQPGCPLTNTILNLALKHLGDRIFDLRYKCDENHKHKSTCKEIMTLASVCYQRQVLLIHSKLEGHEVEIKVKDFKDQVKKSGIKIRLFENTFCCFYLFTTCHA